LKINSVSSEAACAISVSINSCAVRVGEVAVSGVKEVTSRTSQACSGCGTVGKTPRIGNSTETSGGEVISSIAVSAGCSSESLAVRINCNIGNTASTKNGVSSPATQAVSKTVNCGAIRIGVQTEDTIEV
jgi:hypothetical protein